METQKRGIPTGSAELTSETTLPRSGQEPLPHPLPPPTPTQRGGEGEGLLHSSTWACEKLELGSGQPERDKRSFVDKMSSHFAHTVSSFPGRDLEAGEHMTPQAAIPWGCPLALLSTGGQHRCRTEKMKQARWPGGCRTPASGLVIHLTTVH